MIEDKILDYNKDELISYLRYEAGSSSPAYFLCEKEEGLRLQQVPEEFCGLLLWLKEQKFEKYLELGIGDGGSFLLNVFFQSDLKKAVCVDNCAYWQNEQYKRIQEKITFLKNKKQECEITFVNSKTDDFFAQNTEKFPCIFVDADHSYEAVKKDFENSLKILEDGGCIILHDINSRGCPGIIKLWKEIKNDKCKKFVYSDTCGIGIFKQGI